MDSRDSLRLSTEQRQRVLDDTRRSLGDEHPQTLTAMLDLAEAMWALGRLIAARELEEQVVAGREGYLAPVIPIH